ncbi:MAG: hypothetical protein IKI85_06115, partial [Bacteroidales bacterium]|nr:hypothetical protein [Bacteroidales bacterium]
SGLRAALDAGYRRQRGLWHWKAALGGGLYRPFAGGLRIPEEYTDARVSAYWQEQYARICAGSYDAHLLLYAERQLSARLSLYAQASGGAGFPTGFGSAFYSTLCLGINF